jgi:hypothetical protein
MQRQATATAASHADDSGMQNAIVFVALVLFGVLVSSVWLRRADLEFSGEAGSLVPVLVLCLVSVVLILAAAA